MWAQIFNAFVLMMEKKEIKNSNVKKEKKRETDECAALYAKWLHVSVAQP